MKSKKILFSILVGICSVLCSFGLFNKTSNQTVSAAQNVSCYTMVLDENFNTPNNTTTYVANTSVGKASGDGKYTLDTKDLTLTAEANANFQIVGWKVVYEDQGNKSIFINTSDLTSGAKTINLTSKDSVDVRVEVKFSNTTQQEIYNKSSFKLARVFENLTVTPVFDHSYYQLENAQNSLFKVYNEPIKLKDESELYFKTKSQTDGEFKYENATIVKDTKAYYYGTIYSKDDKFYTLHNLLENTAEGGTPRTRKVDYTKGAFKVNDQVKANFDIAVEEKLETSKNIDVIGAEIELRRNNSESLPLVNDINQNKGYHVEKDNMLRTKQVQINFNIQETQTAKNSLILKYHNLYAVTLNIQVDGVAASTELVGGVSGTSELDEVYGISKQTSNKIEGNISLNNFYSKNNNNTQFLVKRAIDNGSQSFDITCVAEIGKYFEKRQYIYYVFDTMNRLNTQKQIYANISENQQVDINYLSEKFNVNYECLEYTDINNIKSLTAFEGTPLESQTKKRGETINLSEADLSDVKNYGYEFVGYSLSDDPDNALSAQKVFTLTIDKDRPNNVTVYMIYKKIEYTVKFTNFNKVSLNDQTLGNIFPLISIGFNVLNQKEGIQSKSFAQTHLGVQSEIDTQTKIKLGGRLEISYIKNSGFNIVGFACKETVASAEEYFADDALELTSEFIQNNEDCLQGNVLTIHITEEIEKYTITFKINPTKDDKLNSDVIMANISATADDASQAEIKLFNLDDEEVANSSIDTVATVVISNLQYQDKVTLKSETKSVGEGGEKYYYMFNHFTADGTTSLSEILKIENINSKQIVTVATHIENVAMNKTITVVYSMPETMLSVQADEDSVASANFKLKAVVSQEGRDNFAIEGAGSCIIDSKSFSVQVEKVFGFELVGYSFNGADVDISTYTVNISQSAVATDSNNKLILKFKAVEYQFQFKQNGAGDGFVKFGEDDFVNLTLDTDLAKQSNETGNFVSIEITKPEGYFVKNVAFGNDGSSFNSVNHETNEFRNNINRNKFIFKISVEDFQLVIESKSTQEGPVIKVLVNLYYEVFRYTITIQPTISNSQGVNDMFVTLPSFKAVETVSNKQITSENLKGYVTFTQVAHGTPITINLATDPSTGMGKLGFQQIDNYLVDYTRDLNTLNITKTTNDLVFAYNIYYLPVEIVIETNNMNYGDVIAFVDNMPSQSIMLFNKLEIVAKGNINQGYVFEEISYHEIQYVQYEHSEESWEQLKGKLYTLNGKGQYELSSNLTYDKNTTYYIKEVNEVVISAGEVKGETVFTIESFNFDKWLITETEDGKLQLVFNVKFKLLEMTIVNMIVENDENGKLSEAGAYNNQSMLKFNVEEFATFKLVKTDSDKNQTDITAGGIVTYNDSLAVTVQINNHAINLIDGKEYDLSLGLKLESVKIYTSSIPFTETSTGKYTFIFEVKQHFGNLFGNENIQIEYSFVVNKFKLETTTVVTESIEFYDNVLLNINAKDYGFAGTSKSSEDEVNNGSIVLTQDLQYLATGKTYINLLNAYKNDFVIYGINAYLNGNKIKESDLELYSIKELPGEGNENSYLFQMFGNLRVEFLIRPKITFNNDGPSYKKDLKYDEKGYALPQGISVGTTNKYDLQISNLLVNTVKFTYKKEDGLTVENEVKNAGKYHVDLSFDIPKGAQYDWLRMLKVEGEITFEILKKEISLSYDKQNIEQVTKPYDGNSGYNVSSVYPWLIFTDGAKFNINYSDTLEDRRFSLKQIDSYISPAGRLENDEGVKDADETKYYNFYLYNIALNDNEFNNNFYLSNNDLIIEKYIQITRAPLKIQNLQVYSKVYDGTTNAELVAGVKLGILGIIPGDKVSIDNLNNIKLFFEDAEVGTNKKVIVDATDAITGDSAHNYFVESSNVQGLTIYPYKISVKVEGRGLVELINERGLTDKELVDLIPIGAELKVLAFKKDSNPYVDIYSKIRSRVRGRNEFVVGYQLVMIYDGNQIPIDNNLHLSIPSIKDLTGAFYLYDNKTGEVSSTTEEGRLIIDLQPIDGNIEYVFLIHKRTLLKPWQIVLIVVGSTLVVAGGVLAFIFIRKHKKSKDAVHEKI